ncbi:MAG: hypothetical protein MI922_20405 [Bacteroidales bacterium]|nr:hypothetical protein [Bacteroidales bacterium]
MKLRKELNYNIALLLLIICTSVAQTQDLTYEKQKEWKYKVDSDVLVAFKNYDCNLQIETSPEKEVVFTYEVIAEGADKEDIEKLNKFLDDLTFKHSSSNVELSSVIWKNYNSTDIGISKKIKMELLNGEKINLREFEFSCSLKIPDGSKLDLNTKYSNIGIEEVNQLILQSFDDNIACNDIAEHVSINAKYSKLTMESMENATLNLFDCHYVADKCENLTISTKYSKVNIQQAENVTISSFDDKFDIHTCENLTINAKYSDYVGNKVENISATYFDSDIQITSAENIVLGKSKYTKYAFDAAETMVVSESFDDEFRMQHIESIGFSDVKYSKLIIGHLESKITLKGYDTNVDIQELSDQFQLCTVDLKYGKVSIKIPGSLAASFKIKYKYGSLHNNLKDFTTISDNKGETEKVIEGKTTNSPESTARFSFNNYSADIHLGNF